MANTENTFKTIKQLLITDTQKRLRTYGQGIFFNNESEFIDSYTLLVDNILRCDNIDDVNKLIFEYSVLFTSEGDYGKTRYFTMEGTTNYIMGLMVDEINTLEKRTNTDDNVRDVTNDSNEVRDTSDVSDVCGNDCDCTCGDSVSTDNGYGNWECSLDAEL